MLELDGVTPFYQGIYGQNGVAGFEVLARVKDGQNWKSAAGIVEELEQRNRIFDFDMTMWRKVLANLAQADVSDKFVTVNTSVRTLEDDRFIESISGLLAQYEVAARLYIEVTETARAKSVENVTAVLRDVEGVGVGIILDDIGCGADGLAMMMSVENAEFVKFSKEIIDLACNGSKRALGILKYLVQMAEENELRVICEGVETKREKTVLEKIGRNVHMQGWFFSKAVSFERVLEELMVVETC